MPRPKQESSPSKSGKEVRLEVRNYIKNERDTVLMKWLTLGETVKSVDREAARFAVKQQIKRTNLPINIQKFIGTLKRCVRKVIKKKGGTPYSIVRSLFMYWGAGGTNAAGTLNGNQMHKCMSSLAVEMNRQEIDEVVTYYASSKEARREMGETAAVIRTDPNAVMNYSDLLADITEGEPSVVMDTGPKYFAGDDIETRFKEHEDNFIEMPVIVKHFVEATQNFVLTQMRTLGGTPHQHVRELFQRFDYNQSNGLDEDELQMACHKKMHLVINRDQARDIVKYYDRKRTGQMNYDVFLKDVTKGTKPILAFTEVTPEERSKGIQSLAANPLMPKPFHPKPNKVLEKTKLRLKAELGQKVGNKGGRIGSWLTEAFQSYDKGGNNTLRTPEDVQGAMKRSGINIDIETGNMLIRGYDIKGDGNMHYKLFIQDMEDEDIHFMKTSNVSPIKISLNATSRTPSGVAKTIRMLKTSCEVFARKSGYKLNPRDLLYGTCLRFDLEKCGRLPPFSVMNVIRELNINNLKQDDVNSLVEWFDTNATHSLDYNALTRQLYGDDIMNSALQLPKLNKNAGKAEFTDTVKYIQGIKDFGHLNLGHSESDTTSISLHQSTVFNTNSLTNMSSPTQGSSPNRPKLKKIRNRDNPNYVLLKKHSDDPVGGVGKDGECNPVVESPAIQQARLSRKRELVLNERRIVEQKLKQVDDMRKRLSDDHTRRKNAAHEAEIAAQHKEAYEERVAERLAQKIMPRQQKK
jgi:Ca2+-binding EF-hand superfamily protein